MILFDENLFTMAILFPFIICVVWLYAVTLHYIEFNLFNWNQFYDHTLNSAPSHNIYIYIFSLGKLKNENWLGYNSPEIKKKKKALINIKFPTIKKINK